jgi:hypothetical protein
VGKAGESVLSSLTGTGFLIKLAGLGLMPGLLPLANKAGKVKIIIKIMLK